jgi:hypothetical protein
MDFRYYSIPDYVTIYPPNYDNLDTLFDIN